MKVAAIVAEYNPFHQGHAYQLRKVRELSGADFIVVVMSGDWVQRGEPAIVDKYVRSEMALRCGADLVLELPLAAATGSAGDFAKGALATLEKLGCVDELWFGGESDDMELFGKISQILACEPDNYRAALRKNLSAGKSFPAAREAAILQALVGGETGQLHDEDGQNEEGCQGIEKRREISQFLRGSNNILGLEYCLAIKKYETQHTSERRIIARVLLRSGDDYHEEEIHQGFASAQAIRCELYKCETEDERSSQWRKQIPPQAMLLLDSYIKERGILSLDDFSDMLAYQLLHEDKESLTARKDISPDLANRIYTLRDQFTSITGFADLVRTRNKTLTAVQRALVHILLQLGDSKEERQKISDPSFVRVLGFARREDQMAIDFLLHKIKNNGSIQLITKASQLKNLPAGAEVQAAELYEMRRAMKKGDRIVNELSRPIYIYQD